MDITPSPSLVRKIRERAPTKTISENWGRTGGYYGDSDESTRIYRAVLVYIEQGLGAAQPLFEAVRKVIDKVQPNNVRYIVIPVAYGDDGQLHHGGRPIPVHGELRFTAGRVFLETCMKVSGDIAVERPYVPALYPKTDIRSLYQGKIAVDRNDLLLFITRTAPLMFAAQAVAKVRRCRKQAVVVSYDGAENAEWSFLTTDPEIFEV